MPRKPPRPCGRPGCRALAYGKRRLCPPHLEEAEAREREASRQRHRKHDATRPSAHRRGYGPTHRRVRLAFLAANPICPCGREATEMDHIVPLAEGGDPFCWENLQGLCKRCHSSKTARFDRGRRRGRRGRGRGPRST